MSDPRDELWDTFEQAGEIEIRKRLAFEQYAGHRKTAAEAWLAHKVSFRRSEREEATLAEVRSANALALASNALAEDANAAAQRANCLAELANASAERAARANEDIADQTRKANVIATIAIIAAVIAMAVSIIGIFMK